mgnify:FL=1
MFFDQQANRLENKSLLILPAFGIAVLNMGRKSMPKRPAAVKSSLQDQSSACAGTISKKNQ